MSVQGTKTIRWGILGCGHIAQKFASDINITERNVIQAAASRDGNKAAAFADKYKAKTSYGSYEDMVLDPEVDIVYVATPHMRHFEDSVMCLNAGKHVLCEKPVTVKYDEAVMIYRLANEKKLFFMEALWTCFHPAFRKALEWAESGKIGKVLQVSADFGIQSPVVYSNRIYNPELAGGSLLDVGIYPAFLAMQFMNAPRCTAAEAVFSPTGIDSSCSWILKSDSGQLASLCSSVETVTPVLASVSGEKGRIVFDRMFFMDVGATLETAAGKERAEGSGEGFGYQQEVAHCADCLRKGYIESPFWTADKSLKLQAVLRDIREKIGLKYPFE
jgi:predicted dehydrogenase